MLIPEFSEDRDNIMLLYFPVEGDINAMYKELETTYVCFQKMNRSVKNGKEYVVLEVLDEQ